MHYDFYRRNRLEKKEQLEDFCTVVKDIVSDKRTVVAIQESCGPGNYIVKCNGCVGGQRAKSAYSIKDSDLKYNANNN